MVTLDNIDFSYHRSVSFFRDVNLELKKGQVYGLLGRNGTGKTTLLKLISSQLRPQRGGCFVCGFNSKARSLEMLRSFFYVPETFRLPAMRLKGFVDTYGCFYPNFNEVNFYTWIEKAGFDKRQKLSNMSLGQCKRVILMFALATEVPLLLLDEPLSGLDISTKSLVKKMLVESMNEERLIVISTHQIHDIQYLIDHLIVMEKANILYNRSIEDIVAAFSVVQRGVGVLEEDSVYMEEGFGDRTFLVPRRADDRSDTIDLELLFKASVANPYGMLQVLDGVAEDKKENRDQQ